MSGATPASADRQIVRQGTNDFEITLFGDAQRARLAFFRDELALTAEPGADDLEAIVSIRPLTATLSADKRVPTPGSVNLKKLLAGGPAQWEPSLVTVGHVSQDTSAYVVDTVALPETNPWRSPLKLTGLDFFSDGRCAVSTLNGDVWVASGLSSNLARVVWKRFATGLFQPLGLRIRDDVIYVLGRDRIYRLQDLNEDGEADKYESFNGDVDVYPTYHAFSYDLHTDRAGNFYFVTDGNMVDPNLPLHGSLLKVNRDGSLLEEVATGFRAGNGMGIGPNDEITVSDNQGHWTPASKISWIKPGGFYGYGGDPRTNLFPRQRKAPVAFDAPLCWIPITADNSSGSQVWAVSDRWGPLQGHLLHTSYGKSALFHVMTEEVGGQWQGGVVQFPLQFASGIMRARFHPVDGQLYVCGLKGWQTTGARDGCLQRVRYTGRPMYLPLSLQSRTNGIQITFASGLTQPSASDVQNYAVSQWNYRWSREYGSPDFSVRRPNEKGRDTLSVKRATLAPEGRSVFLEIEDMQPAMQTRIKYRLQAQDGTMVEQEIFSTIHRLN